MSSAQEIRSKISSIQSTQKITKAMQMVAASKMRKAQDRMYLSRPYVERVGTVINHVTSSSMVDYVHPYTVQREVKKVGFIIVSSDRGLCGGLNINLFKKALNKIKSLKEKNIDSDVAIVGTKAYHYFLRNDVNIVAKINHLGDEPILRDLIGVITVMLELYEKEKIDELYIAYNGFINTMSQSLEVKKLLPVSMVKFADEFSEEELSESLNATSGAKSAAKPIGAATAGNNNTGFSEIDKKLNEAISDAKAADESTEMDLSAIASKAKNTEELQEQNAARGVGEILDEPMEKAKKKIKWDYIYEPSPHLLLNSLFNRYVESLVYQSVVENVACEQAARMVAMQSATDNAEDLIKDFNLLYNKVRQASITRELSEIIAGAAAV